MLVFLHRRKMKWKARIVEFRQASLKLCLPKLSKALGLAECKQQAGNVEHIEVAFPDDTIQMDSTDVFRRYRPPVPKLQLVDIRKF